MKKSPREIEEDMVEFYSQMLRHLYPSLDEARNEVKKIIESCKEIAKKDGTDDLPENFGDLIMKGYESGDPKSKKLVEKACNEGATDEDIKKWWNLHDLERRMMISIDNIFRGSLFYKAKDEGLSSDEAAERVRKTFPMYGNPEDTSKLTRDDRLIPHELRDRVNVYLSKHRTSVIQNKLTNYSSFNVFIRAEIRLGNL